METKAETAGGAGGRLMSIDALRGADMLFIMGFASAVVALCSFLGAPDCWLARQMTHVQWHGFRHHDTIFPLFLFLAGASWPFSLARQLGRGKSRLAVSLGILRRVAILVFLGAVCGGLLSFDFSRTRYCSVLGHIGVCWGLAALASLFVKDWRKLLAIAAALLVVHWLVLFLFTAPDDVVAIASEMGRSATKKVAAYASGGTDGFSFYGNVAGWIDRCVTPGRLYEAVFDPEGLFAKVSGAALAILGVVAGTLLRCEKTGGGRKAALLAASAAASLALCLAWSPWCPVNKKLWTATFVLASAAYSFGALALFYWTIDVRGCRRWTFFFRVIGMNSIAIYMLMDIVPFREVSKFFVGGLADIGGNVDLRNFVILLGQLAVEWLVLLFLYRKSTFLRV